MIFKMVSNSIKLIPSFKKHTHTQKSKNKQGENVLLDVIYYGWEPPKLRVLTHMILVGNQSEQSKQDGVQRQIFLANYALILHTYHRNRNWCMPVYSVMSRPATI